MSNLRSLNYSKNLEEKIWIELKNLNCDPDDISRIRECIIRLSDHFIKAEAKSPLAEKWAQIAYLAYYLPLNHLRAQAVCAEAKRLGFFEGIASAIDIGSGLGSLTLSLLEFGPELKNLYSTDVSNEALKIQKNILADRSGRVHLSNQEDLKANVKLELAALSYSWNEFSPLEKAKFLEQVDSFEAILVIEPSTSMLARNLMELRSQLIKKGFFAWGPCTHQLDCPLLTHSKTDWCHDRIGIEKSKWSSAIEKNLPFKNETLTFSYLLMRKTKPSFETKVLDAKTYAPARIIGDELKEKGKTRQAVCRSSEREFLAWFPQRVKHNIFRYTHGEFAQINIDTQKKSNELRIEETDIINKKG